MNALELQWLGNSADALQSAILQKKLMQERAGEREATRSMQREMMQERRGERMEDRITQERMHQENLAVKSEANQAAMTEFWAKQGEVLSEGIGQGLIDESAGIEAYNAIPPEQRRLLDNLPIWNALKSGKVKKLPDQMLWKGGVQDGQRYTAREIQINMYAQELEQMSAMAKTPEEAVDYKRQAELMRKSIINRQDKLTVAEQVQVDQLKAMLIENYKLQNSYRAQQDATYREELKRENEKMTKQLEKVVADDQPATPVIQPPNPALDTGIKTNAAGTATAPMGDVMGGRLRYDMNSGTIK